MRIQDAQKHTNPMGSDPQHCYFNPGQGKHHLCLPHIVNADAAEAGEVGGDGG